MAGREKDCRWVWPVGSSMASESRELSAACGLSGQVWRVSQGNWRRSVVCRDKYGEWVKGIVGGCGLSGQVWRVGQENWRRRVVCRRVWSVGAKTSSGSRELATAFGLPGQVCCVGQEACRRRVVCRRENGEWVKRPVGGCGLAGQVCCVGQGDCR